MPETMATKIARAMEGLASIAKYYKRHGSVPQFTVIDSPIAKRKAPRPIWRPDNICVTCGKQFVAPTAVRCQCQPQTKHGKGMKRRAQDEVA